MKKVKLNNMAVSFVMFIVCVCLMCVMFMQFRTVEETDITDIKNMREAELRKSLAEWKSKYEEVEEQLNNTNQKIKEYNEKIGKSEEAAELIDKELEQSNLAVGKTDVEGEGVVITLKDTEEKDVEGWDLLNLINELKNAGAEAISINDVRIINTSEIADLGGYSYISVGQQRLEGPYVVKAIGSQAYLSSILNLKDSGYVDQSKSRGIDVKVEPNKKIEIPKYNGEMAYKYLKVEEETK